LQQAAAILLTACAARPHYAAMRLEDWLNANGLTNNALAERVGCSPHTIARARRGEPVRSDVAREIVCATGHEVDVLSLLYPDDRVGVTVRFNAKPPETDPNALD